MYSLNKILSLFLFLSSLFLASLSFSQKSQSAGTKDSSYYTQTRIDSLQDILKKTKSDTQRVVLLNHLATYLWDSKPKQAKSYLQQALKRSTEIRYTKGLAITYDKLGYAESEESNSATALEYYQQALLYYKRLGAQREEADVLNQIGRIYDERGAHTQALENYLASQRISEQLRDSKRLAVIRGNIGIIYSELGDEEKALALFSQSLKDHNASGNSVEAATTYINMGVSHQKIGNLKAAEENYQKAKEIFEDAQDTRGLAFAYGNLGDVLILQERIREALTFYERSKELFQDLNNSKGIAMTQTQIGIAYLLMDNFKEAERYLSSGLAVAQRIKVTDIEKTAQYYLSQCYEFQGKFKQALQHFQRYEKLKGELLNLEKSRALAEVQAQHTLQKREEAFKEQQKKQENTHKAEMQQQNALILIGSALLITFFIVGILQYYNSREKQMTNQILMQQRDKITHQRDAIEEKNEVLYQKNTQIQQSIGAAQTIQQAILPPKEKMDKLFDDHFVIYRPKDVVSGDFFWTGKVRDCRYLAMVDCTGHGVPGAFMSLIGNTLLDKIILLQRVHDPSQILERLHEEVFQALHQHNSGDNSGMDVALVALEETKEDTTLVKFAGAKRPLCYTNKGKWESLSGDRRSVGGLRPVKMPFTTQEITLTKGDVFYLFSDGFADQHNEKRQKMGSRKFKETLAQLSVKNPLEKQKAALEAALQIHQGKQEQRDDILVLGVKV